MPKIDVASVPEQTSTNYPEPYRKVVAGRSRKRLGNAIGLDQFGVNICTLKPGAASSLRHAHEREDELVYMLEGEVVMVEDHGETVLRPGDAAGWKANSGIHHHLINRSDRNAVFLEVGTRAQHERATYTDADLIVVRDANGSRALHKSGEPYPRD
jgi:uncharacterized cupin superfamily protein